MRRTFKGSSARHCDARTSRTWDVPMPNATAPNAPCVEVWLSPHAIVMPGCVSPSSGPMTWTMPCRVSDRSQRGTPNSRQFRSRAAIIASAMTSANGRSTSRVGTMWSTVAKVRDGEPHLPAARAQHVERLRAGHLVDEVQPDEQLRLPGRQAAHGVRVPDFFQKGLCHRADE